MCSLESEFVNSGKTLKLAAFIQSVLGHCSLDKEYGESKK